MTEYLPIIAGVVMALFGGGGFLFTILRYHRDEASSVIAQHSAILEDMRNLYAAMKTERDELHEEVIDLRTEVAKLRRQIVSLKNGLEPANEY